MSFLHRERMKLNVAITETIDDRRRGQLYAAQQALAWAEDPIGFASPFAFLMGIAANSKDCPAEYHPPQSSDIHGPPKTFK